MSNKVLIITYYWPPSGGPGVQRILKFVKYLPEFGWEPVVLTVNAGEYPAVDRSLEEEIPPGCQVFKTNSVEFYRLFKWLTGRRREDKIETFVLVRNKNLTWLEKLLHWVRNNLFIPDARIGWYPFAIRKGMEIIRTFKPRVIFTCSPPHSLHLIGRRLSSRSGLKWVADFRDPWTQAFYDKGIKRISWAEQIHRNLEQAVLYKADVLTSVSTGVKTLLGSAPEITSKVKVLLNGYDPDDFNYVIKSRSDKLRIVYTGHVAPTQNPINLWQALSELDTELLDDFEIRFFGSTDKTVIERAHAMGLHRQIHFNSYIPHYRVIQEISNAEVLLLLIPETYSTGILTGKLFEYMGSQNRILGIGDPEGEAARLIKKCKAGHMYSYDHNLKPPLLNIYRQWKEGVEFRPDVACIKKYERRAITEDLATIFNDLCI